MLQFTYKLKIAERVKGKCSRHPRYNPEKMDAPESVAHVHAVSPSMTSIRPASPWTPPNASSSAERRPGLVPVNPVVQEPRVRPTIDRGFTSYRSFNRRLGLE